MPGVDDWINSPLGTIKGLFGRFLQSTVRVTVATCVCHVARLQRTSCSADGRLDRHTSEVTNFFAKKIDEEDAIEWVSSKTYFPLIQSIQIFI